MESESCENCKFRRGGYCHKNPPKAVIASDNSLLSGWPCIEDHPAPWCGEWKEVD